MFFANLTTMAMLLILPPTDEWRWVQYQDGTCVRERVVTKHEDPKYTVSPPSGNVQPGPTTAHDCDDDDCDVKVKCVDDPKCKGKKKCKDIPIVKDPNPLPQATGKTIPAYSKPCTETWCVIKVPHEVKHVQETIEIEKRTFKNGCCQYTVCVPVRHCCQKRTKCELLPRRTKIHLCRRTIDGLIDVYAREVPGMPIDWVLMHKATDAEVKAQFGITPK